MSTGECTKVVPLVFEHFELWGEEAYDYLKELAKGSGIRRLRRTEECS